MSSSVEALHPPLVFPFLCAATASQTVPTTPMSSTARRNAAMMSSGAVRVGASLLSGHVMAEQIVMLGRMKRIVDVLDWMRPSVPLVDVCRPSTCVMVCASARMDRMSGTVSGLTTQAVSC